MDKDKNWLLHEVRNLPCEIHSGYSRIKVVDLFPLFHQLGEPVKVVIPQFVATFILDSRLRVGCIITAIWEVYEYEYKDMYEWVLEDGNDEVLMKAFVNGYEVEKEKLYYVVSPDNLTMLYKDNGVEVKSSHGYLLSQVTQHGFEHTSFYQLTEKEIKDYDERFWPFSVEVAE